MFRRVVRTGRKWIRLKVQIKKDKANKEDCSLMVRNEHHRLPSS